MLFVALGGGEMTACLGSDRSCVTQVDEGTLETLSCSL